jgi:hypothetical protein
MWQVSQGTVTCAPVSGKPVLRWSKLTLLFAGAASMSLFGNASKNRPRIARVPTQNEDPWK